MHANKTVTLLIEVVYSVRRKTYQRVSKFWKLDFFMATRNTCSCHCRWCLLRTTSGSSFQQCTGKTLMGLKGEGRDHQPCLGRNWAQVEMGW